MRGKMTSDISTTPAVALVPLDLSTAVSNDSLQEVGGLFGGALQPRPHGVTNRARVGS